MTTKTTTTTRTITHADLLARIDAAPDTARIYMRSRWLWVELAESIIEIEIEDLTHPDPHGHYLRADSISPGWTGSGLELYYEDLPEDAYTGATVTPEGVWDLIPDGTNGTPVELVVQRSEDEVCWDDLKGLDESFAHVSGRNEFVFHWYAGNELGYLYWHDTADGRCQRVDLDLVDEEFQPPTEYNDLEQWWDAIPAGDYFENVILTADGAEEAAE